ncbi:MAG: hypothetical protein FWF76_00405 [Oscillospiraceae bacterium]|nr:hypothetical protein [Oscillospiraceae bacterium]
MVDPVYSFNRNIRLMHNSRHNINTATHKTAVAMLAKSTAVLSNTFGVRFNYTGATANSGLNGYNCPNSGVNAICNTRCGADSNCHSVHHKSAGRLVGVGSSPANTHTVRFVEHRTCGLPGGRHAEVAGVAQRRGRESLVTMRPIPNQPLVLIMLHELSHNLDAPDCNNNGCVMGPVMTANWCNSCARTIRTFIG